MGYERLQSESVGSIDCPCNETNDSSARPLHHGTLESNIYIQKGSYIITCWCGDRGPTRAAENRPNATVCRRNPESAMITKWKADVLVLQRLETRPRPTRSLSGSWLPCAALLPRRLHLRGALTGHDLRDHEVMEKRDMGRSVFCLYARIMVSRESQTVGTKLCRSRSRSSVVAERPLSFTPRGCLSRSQCQLHLSPPTIFVVVLHCSSSQLLWMEVSLSSTKNSCFAFRRLLHWGSSLCCAFGAISLHIARLDDND
jgi:hypothetical protein